MKDLALNVSALPNFSDPVQAELAWYRENNAKNAALKELELMCKVTEYIESNLYREEYGQQLSLVLSEIDDKIDKKENKFNSRMIEQLFELVYRSRGRKEIQLALDIITFFDKFLDKFTRASLYMAGAGHLSETIRSTEGKKEKELELQHKLVMNFSKSFPNFEYIKSEAKTKAGGFIDILAREKTTNRPVLMELKLGNKNCARQLYGYAVDFENPLLISITQERVNKQHSDIVYLIFDDLI